MAGAPEQANDRELLQRLGAGEVPDAGDAPESAAGPARLRCRRRRSGGLRPACCNGHRTPRPSCTHLLLAPTAGSAIRDSYLSGNAYAGRSGVVAGTFHVCVVVLAGAVHRVTPTGRGQRRGSRASAAKAPAQWYGPRTPSRCDAVRMLATQNADRVTIRWSSRSDRGAHALNRPHASRPRQTRPSAQGHG